MMTAPLLLVLLLQATPLDRLTPPLPTAHGRQIADVVSFGTVIAGQALDARESWRCEDRTRCFAWQGLRVGVTYGAVFAVKALVRRQRPCAAWGCGIDNPHFSFYSAHTALAFTAVGRGRIEIIVPLAVSTGGLRVAAGKHYLTDVLVGAGVGWLTSKLEPAR